MMKKNKKNTLRFLDLINGYFPKKKEKRNYRQSERILAKVDRRKEIDPSKFPYSPIGLIRRKKSEVILEWGTGVMIYPMVVLTAAHIVYDKVTKTKYNIKDFEFIPNAGEGENLAKFGKFKILESFFSEEYKSDLDEDYAILILDKGNKKNYLGLETGYFGLRIIRDIRNVIDITKEEEDIFLDLEEFKKGSIGIYGYPTDKYEKTYGIWGMDLKVEEKKVVIKDDIIKYDIDTFSGQSGSGIYFKKKNCGYYIIGVHISGEDDNFNKGVLITEKRLKNIKKWIILGLLKNKFKFREGLIKCILEENRGKLNLGKYFIGDKGMEYENIL